MIYEIGSKKLVIRLSKLLTWASLSRHNAARRRICVFACPLQMSYWFLLAMQAHPSLVCSVIRPSLLRIPLSRVNTGLATFSASGSRANPMARLVMKRKATILARSMIVRFSSSVHSSSASFYLSALVLQRAKKLASEESDCLYITSDITNRWIWSALASTACGEDKVSSVKARRCVKSRFSSLSANRSRISCPVSLSNTSIISYVY